jgi:hypothetical protein
VVERDDLVDDLHAIIVAATVGPVLTRSLVEDPMRVQAVRMGVSQPLPTSSEHNVSDPGVTLLQVVTYTVGALALVAVAVAMLRGRRRAGDTNAAKSALSIGPILDKLKAVVGPLLQRVLG